MKLFGFGIFKPSSLKDFVMKIIGEVVVASGTGKTFLVSPLARFVSVPTAERTVSFDFTELTSDTQSLNVQGELSVVLLPEVVTQEHDFTINVTKNGTYVDPRVLVNLDSKIVKMVQPTARSLVQSKTLKLHIENVAVLADELIAAVIARVAEFKGFGVDVKRVFVHKVSPDNQDISDAFEAKEREELLTTADKAVAKRRMQAATDERSLREYEAETAQTMEKKRSELIKVQNANLLKVAEAQAQAKKKELSAYDNLDSGTIFALAMNRFAQEGRVGTLNITPDFLEAMRVAANGKPSGRS